MKTGDLVNFYSTISTFRKSYCQKNPGVVIASEKKFDHSEYHDKRHAYVLWSTGEITREHFTYLKIVDA